MKVRSMLGALTLTVAAVFEAGTTVDSAQSSAPAAASIGSAGDARIGKATFTQECSICHGATGGGFIGPHIGGIDWTAPGLKAIVRGGLGGYGGMPAFNPDVVTDRNIADIAAYLASLAPATSVQPKNTPVAVTVAASEVTPSPTASASNAPPAFTGASAASPSSASTASTDGNTVHGRQTFSTYCAGCHGASGQGGFGPSLRGEKTRKDLGAAIAWIKNPKPPMPKLYPDPLSESDVKDVATYIESL